MRTREHLELELRGMEHLIQEFRNEILVSKDEYPGCPGFSELLRIFDDVYFLTTKKGN